MTVFMPNIFILKVKLVSTTKLLHLLENIQSRKIVLSESIFDEIRQLPRISGSRNGPVLHKVAPEMVGLSPPTSPKL